VNALNVRIGADIRLSIQDTPKPLADALRRRLTFTNPERKAAERGGRFAHHIPSTVSLLSTAGADMVIPRGAIGIVREEAANHVVPLTFASSVSWFPSKPAVASFPPLAGRDYQIEAENALLSQVQGYVVLPCGGGKTVLGSRALVRSRQAGLVLVYSDDLLEQWVWALRRVLLGNVRVISGGRSGKRMLAPLAPREIAVATVQRLRSAGEEVLPLLQSAGALLTDEAHHCPADDWRFVLGSCPARYRWGLTATPERPDGWGFLLPLLIGPQLYRKRAADLVAMGHLVLPRVIPVRSGWTIPSSCYVQRFRGPAVGAGDERLDFTRATEALHADPGRSTLVRELAAAGAKSGRSVLVLVGRVEASDQLAEELRALGVEAESMTGARTKTDRRAVLSRARQGRTRVLVATQLADEGLDIPRLDLLILAAPGRAAGRAIQRVGRLMRPSGAPPIAIDLVDGGLEHQWRSRANAYEQEIEATPERMIDGPAALALVRGLVKS